MKTDAISLALPRLEELRKILRGHEARLAAAEKQRETLLIDMLKARAAGDKGDQQARFELASLNKQDAAAGRLVLSIAAQVAAAGERVAMALNQIAVMEARAGAMPPLADGAPVRWFEVTTPDHRVVRHRAASLEALRGALLKGYTVTAEVFGASRAGLGGVAAQIGSDVPSIMAGLLAAHGDELLTFLAERGIKAA